MCSVCVVYVSVYVYVDMGRFVYVWCRIENSGNIVNNITIAERGNRTLYSQV